MGRCMKCNHYDICSDDRINCEEVWGQCRYFEDETIPMVPKSEYNRAEAETAKKIFDDLDELLTEIRSDARQKREANGGLEHSLHFYTGKVVACGEIIGKLSELKKKYKLED